MDMEITVKLRNGEIVTAKADNDSFSFEFDSGWFEIDLEDRGKSFIIPKTEILEIETENILESIDDFLNE